MNKQLSIPDVKLITQKRFYDERGFFFENFNQDNLYNEIGFSCKFVQDNVSISEKNVLRGLHIQVSPKAQSKLISVIDGEIFDVAVDVRKTSPTFGQYISIILSSKASNQLFIPKGFAHGFLVLSEKAIVTYKTSDYYSPKDERSIIWNDNDLNINWPTENVIISKKDSAADKFNDFCSNNLI
jgi:dTDP-4-dehydrorhamnose 3,5-epimerase